MILDNLVGHNIIKPTDYFNGIFDFSNRAYIATVNDESYAGEKFRGLLNFIIMYGIMYGKLRTSLLCFYFYPLCYAAALLKFIYYVRYYAQEEELLLDYYAYICNFALQFTTCSRQFLYRLFY